MILTVRLQALAGLGGHRVLVAVSEVRRTVPLGHVLLGVRVVGVVVAGLLGVGGLLVVGLLVQLLLVQLLLVRLPVVTSSYVAIRTDRLAIRVLHIPQRVLKQG